MGIGKIQARELAEKLLGGGVVGERGVDFRSERPESNSSPLKPDLRLEGIAPALDALECATDAGVHVVLRAVTAPQIFPDVAKAVAIAVVNIFARKGANDQSVHVRAVARDRVDRAARLNERAPRHRAEPRKISIIHQSQETAREWDFSRHESAP